MRLVLIRVDVERARSAKIGRMAPDSYGRPDRPTSAPAPPPPNEGRRSAAPSTPPTGVREGDLIVIGLDPDADPSEADALAGQLKEKLGLQVFVMLIPGHLGCTVLRPER